MSGLVDLALWPRSHVALSWLALVSLSALALGCEEGVFYPHGETVASLSILPSSVAVPVIGFAQLRATARNAEGIPLPVDDVVWSSSDTSRAWVDGVGFLTARSEGQTLITALLGDIGDTVTVTVEPPPPAPWPEHVCAWVSNGSAYCWGRGVSGELGTGDREGSLVPTLVLSPGGLTAVSTGGGHSCGLKDSGEIWCWGRGAEGQLGGGTTRSSLTPDFVSGGSHFLKVAAGGRHTCGLTARKGAT